MSAVTGLEALARGAILSPFTRVARLLDGITPGYAKVIEMTAGDPKETMPGFVIDKFEEAKASFEHAEHLASTSGGDTDQHLNLAICLRETGRIDEALALYERRLPNLPAVIVNTYYAHTLLTAGRLAEGFAQYEFRWLHPPLLPLRMRAGKAGGRSDTDVTNHRKTASEAVFLRQGCLGETGEAT